MCHVLSPLPNRPGPFPIRYRYPGRRRHTVSAGEVGTRHCPDHCGSYPAEIVLLGGEAMKVVVWKSPRYLNGLLRKLFGFGKDDAE